LIFFFQAEDGIRDFHVTGVQTCALPISTASPQSAPSKCWTHAATPPWRLKCDSKTAASVAPSCPPAQAPASTKPTRCATVTRNRSEERRVGKGRRSRRSRGQSNAQRRIG